MSMSCHHTALGWFGNGSHRQLLLDQKSCAAPFSRTLPRQLHRCLTVFMSQRHKEARGFRAKEAASEDLKINCGETKMLSLTGCANRIIEQFEHQLKSNVRLVSVLLKISKNVSSRMQIFINRCLRSICGIYWPNRISNEKVLRRAAVEPVEIRIRRQKWDWIDHILRKGWRWR